MKTKIKLSAILMLVSLFIFSACGGGDDTTVYQQPEQGPEAGDAIFLNADGAGFMMVYVPAKTFKTGTDDFGTATVAKAFWIDETEVTYELWYTVRQWAITHSYTFANAGREGHDGTIGAAPTNIEPVTYINWRDAMIWCNAATEWYNEKAVTNYTCAYFTDENYTTPIRTATNTDSVTTTAGTEDKPYIKAVSAGNIDMANCTATGFRLLTSNEQELAVRYIDDINNDGDICDQGEYYPGNYASGATADFNNRGANEAVAWYATNSGNTTHAVKGLLPNALGIYDMSGNVSEWCFEWLNTFPVNYRLSKGGNYDSSADILQVGKQSGSQTWYEALYIGLRIARTAD